MFPFLNSLVKLEAPMFAPPPRTDRTVRILAFSDWRVQNYEPLLRFLESGPGIDVILYGGDDLKRLRANPKLVTLLAGYCTTQRLLFVAGNDDRPEDRDWLVSTGYSHNLDHEPFIFGELAFCGLEGTTDGRGPIQHSERHVSTRLAQHLKAIAGHSARRSPPQLIIVSHAPPSGILDLAIRFSERRTGRGIGSGSLRHFLDRKSALLTICGHVHLCGGQQEELPNGNLVLNIASHDDPGAEGRLALIDVLPQSKPSITLFSTKDLHEQDDLLLLHQVGAESAQRLRARGITSLTDISEENRDRMRIPGAYDWQISRWIRQAALLRSGHATLEITEHRHMRFLEERHFVTWDIETDLAQKRIWVIGAHDTSTGEKQQFFNPDDELDCVRRFLSWMAERPNAIPISYNGNRLETRTLSFVLQRHGLPDPCSLVERDIDLCDRLQSRCVHSYRVPFQLKQFASALGFRFRHTDLDGMKVGRAFEDYLRGQHTPDWKKLLEYNQDDVHATTYVLDRLRACIRSRAGNVDGQTSWAFMSTPGLELCPPGRRGREPSGLGSGKQGMYADTPAVRPSLSPGQVALQRGKPQTPREELHQAAALAKLGRLPLNNQITVKRFLDEIRKHKDLWAVVSSMGIRDFAAILSRGSSIERTSAESTIGR